MTDKPRKPRSFEMPSEKSKGRSNNKTNSKPSNKTASKSKSHNLIMLPDEAVDEHLLKPEDLTPPVMKRKPSRFGWGKIALSAFSLLFALGIGLAIDNLIRELFTRNDWLGWGAIVLSVIGAIAVLAIAIKELWALSALRKVDDIRQKANQAISNNDLRAARSVTKQIVNMLDDRAETANGRSTLEEHAQEIMDAKDLIHLTERDLLGPLDKTTRQLVLGSAKKVSIVTAVSPRALVDIGYVLYENMRLIRKIAEQYGGRPGIFSSLRLAREVITHLAATGAIAVGDGMLQQVIGQGLAARLSARLGEGVVNGLLTARIGIAAIDVCRPLQFDAEKRPGISDFLSELANFKKSADNSDRNDK